MKLLFLDESGTIPPPDKIKDKYFVIGGVIIDENDWHDINIKFNSIKQKYGISPDLEIKWRYFSPANKSIKYLKQEYKNALRDDLYKLLISYENVKIISVITSVEDAYKLPEINTQDDLYGYSYTDVITRFQFYLKDLSQNNCKNCNGIVIIDNRLSRDDTKLRNVHKFIIKSIEFLSNHPDYSKKYSNNLIEEVFISPSHHSMGIQLADIVTGAIFRKFEKNDNNHFSKIENSLWKDTLNKFEGYGIRLFPYKETPS